MDPRIINFLRGHFSQVGTFHNQSTGTHYVGGKFSDNDYLISINRGRYIITMNSLYLNEGGDADRILKILETTIKGEKYPIDENTRRISNISGIGLAY